MLSIANLKDPGQAATYYERDDYYTSRQCPSSWWGKGAEQLGLRGVVSREVFSEVLKGILPDGSVLPDSNAGERRPGLDLTFSAPKSVSLMALVAGDRRIIKAHREAVSTALDWLEKTSSRARITESNVTKTVGTGNLLVARFDHDTSRELDPQLHTHAVVLNATKREDGVWRALSNEELFRNKMTAGAIYRAELALRLKSLGYAIENTHADGRFEIADVPGRLIDEFSTRRAQIEKALEEKGFSGSKAAEVAAKDTRAAKKDVDRTKLLDSWKERVKELGLELCPQRTGKRARAKSAEKVMSDRTIRLAIEHFSERSSVFRREELVGFGLERGIGNIGLSSCEAAVDRMVKSGQLIETSKGVYTTEHALSLERKILELAQNGVGIFKPVLEPGELTAKLEGWGLKTDQKEAAEKILGSCDRVVCIQGYAGTGKTRMLRTVRELAEEAGFSVSGFSNTASATNLLQSDSGIKSQTLAMLLSSGRVLSDTGIIPGPSELSRLQQGVEDPALIVGKTPGAGTSAGRKAADRSSEKPKLWIVDEASMMGTRQAADLLTLAQRENARVVLVGDRAQLPSIEAGKPFALLMDRATQAATMSEIIRQKNPAIKKAVEQTICGDHKGSLRTIKSSICEIEDRDMRLRLVANRYLQSQQRPLVITGTNADRRAINELVRAGLTARGELVGQGYSAEILVPSGATEAQLKDARTYQVGDYVRFGRAYRTLGVEKGEYVKVTGVQPDKNQVVLETSAGRTITWQPEKHTKVELFSQEFRELKEGDIIRWTRNDRKEGRRNGELARVVALEAEKGLATVQAADGQHQTLDLTRQKHWEHGYASTIYSAQGKTAGQVVIHLDTRQRGVMGKEAWYVAISRARDSLEVFTDDLWRLPEAIVQELGQKSAIEELEKGGMKTVEVSRDNGLSSGESQGGRFLERLFSR